MEFPKKITFKIILWIGVFVIIGFVQGSVSFAQNDLKANPSQTSTSFRSPYITDHLDEDIVILDGIPPVSAAGISTFPAKKRVRLLNARLKEIAKNKKLLVDDLRLVREADRIGVWLGKELVLHIFDLDTQSDNIPRDVLAKTILLRVSEAITRYRNERSLKNLYKNGVNGFVAILIFSLLILLLRMAHRWLDKFLNQRIKASLDKVQQKTFQIIHSENLWRAFNGLYQSVYIGLIIFLSVLFINYTLSLFPWTRFLSNFLFGLLLDPLRSLGLGFVENIGNLIFLIVLSFITYYILKFFKIFFRGIDQGSIKLASFDQDWAWPTYRIVRFFIVIFAIVIAYPMVPGSSSPAFKGISLFLGVLFSLGSSSFLTNIIAGYSMIYRRAFKRGDIIQVDQTRGTVVNTRLLVTHLRTNKNEEIILPNSLILNKEVKNYTSFSKEEGVILHSTVGIGYEVPWRQVKEMLMSAAERTPGFQEEPKPFVMLRSLGDFAISYEINAYFKFSTGMIEQYSLLHQNILDAFNENGVQIMTPNYVADTKEQKVVEKKDWFLKAKGEN